MPIIFLTERSFLIGQANSLRDRPRTYSTAFENALWFLEAALTTSLYQNLHNFIKVMGRITLWSES
jgi:hypothetical protein